MDVLLYSFNAVFPICFMILLGFLLCRWGVLDKTTAGKLNSLAFYVLVPASLFMTLYRADLRAVMDVPLVLVSVGGTVTVIVCLCIFAPRFIHDGARCGEFIQGVFRGNTAILGLPLVANLYGDTATAMLALPFSFMMILYNASAPVILAVFSGGERPDPKALFLKACKNPFLVGSVLGVIFSLLPFRLPVFVENTVSTIGSTGSCLALIALGGVTELADFARAGRQAAVGAVLRLVVIPVIMLGIGIAVGLRNEQMAVLVCIFCTPTAVGSYVLAQNITKDGTLARQILILTTLLSMLTMFLTIAALRALGVM